MHLPDMTSGHAFSLRREVSSLCTLAGPLVCSNMLISAMQFIDVMMAGRISGTDLAAVGVGSNVWLLFFLAAQGVLTALSPIVSQQYGAGNLGNIGSYVRHGLLLVVPLSLLTLTALQFLTAPLLTTLGVDPALRELGERFVHAISWGAPAICCFLVFRFVLEGMGLTRLVLSISIVGLVFNVAGNIIFMYGYLGAPALGSVGCGVASALSMWLMFLLMLGYILRSSRLALLKRAPPDGLRPQVLGEILRLGLPISGTVLAENGFFIAVTLMMSSISISAVAAHQIAMNYTSVIYMIPMALAAAISVRVGHATGEGKLSEAHLRGICGILVCLAVMTFSALFLLVFNRQIAQQYSTDQNIVTLAASMLLIAAAFQLSDGLQVACSGALRGFKDTRLPFLICLASYWLIGFPLAWRAVYESNAAPQQVWWGFAVGLTVAAMLMIARYMLLARRLVQTIPLPLAVKEELG